jgi:hypothetical protein
MRSRLAPFCPQGKPGSQFVNVCKAILQGSGGAGKSRVAEQKARNLRGELNLNGGLEKTRTSDLFRVKEAL